MRSKVCEDGCYENSEDGEMFGRVRNWWNSHKYPEGLSPNPRTRWHDCDAATVNRDIVDGVNWIGYHPPSVENEFVAGGTVGKPIEVQLFLGESVRFMPNDRDENWTPQPLEATKFGDPKRIFIHDDGTIHTQEFETTQPGGENTMEPLIPLSKVIVMLEGSNYGAIADVNNIQITFQTDLETDIRTPHQVVFTIYKRDDAGEYVKDANGLIEAYELVRTIDQDN